MLLSRGAFRPGPGRYPPPFGELAKRHCKYCAGLRNLLAAHFERHGCGNDHIRAVAGDGVVQWLAQSDEIIRSTMLLTLNQYISSLYQSCVAVGPCQTCGAIPSRIDPGTAKVVAITAASPWLKASTYLRTAAIGSSATTFFDGGCAKVSVCPTTWAFASIGLRPMPSAKRLKSRRFIS
jgi:hypothetical protein